MIFTQEETPATETHESEHQVVVTPKFVTTDILREVRNMYCASNSFRVHVTDLNNFQVSQAGINTDTMEVTVDASKNVTQTQNYSVVVVNPRTGSPGPVKISGGTTTQVTSHEQLTKEPASDDPDQQNRGNRAKSVIKRYEDMEATELDYEPMSSSSSSGNNAKDKGNESRRNTRATRSQTRQMAEKEDTNVADLMRDIQRTHARNQSPASEMAIVDKVTYFLK